MQVRARLATVLFLVVGCHPKSNCDLGAQLEQRAGTGAKDCGHASLTDAGVSKTDECVTSAFDANKPFYAQYDRRGTDSQLTFGIASDASDHVTFLSLDGDPSGGSKAPPVITASRCDSPTVDSSTDRDPLTTPPISCSSTTDIGTTCGPSTQQR